MRVKFRYSMSDTQLRPIVEFRVAGMPEDKSFLGLIDSGSNITYLDSRIADELDIELSGSAESSLGARKYRTWEGPVELVLGQYRWTSTVRFAENWQVYHQILGLHDLFELFKIDIDAETGVTAIDAKLGHPRLIRSALRRSNQI